MFVNSRPGAGIGAEKKNKQSADASKQKREIMSKHVNSLAKWTKWFAAILVIAGTLIIPSPAFAILDPDEDPKITNVRAYSGVLEDNDILVIATYTVIYSVLPAEPIGLAFLGQFRRGTLVLKSVAPIAFNDLGYGKGIFSLYWTEAEALADSIEFNNPNAENYIVSIMGQPGVFSAALPTGESTTINYQDATNTQILLRQGIIDIARELENEVSWITNGFDLIDFSTGAIRLTVQGESYFGQAIPNLFAMNTMLFRSNLSGATFDERDFDTTYSDDLQNFLAGTEMDEAFQDLATLFEISKIWASTAFALIMTLCIASAIMMCLKMLNVDNAGGFAVLTIPVSIVGFTTIGVISMQVTAVLAFLGLAAVGFTMFLRRSG